MYDETMIRENNNILSETQVSFHSLFYFIPLNYNVYYLLFTPIFGNIRLYVAHPVDRRLIKKKGTNI